MPRSVTPLGMVDASGAGASAPNCASRIDRACATAPSASGTSRSVGTRRSPSSDTKYNVALIFGTAGAAATGGVTGSAAAVPGAGRLSKRLNPVNNSTANTTAAQPMSAITAHRCDGGVATLIFTFGLPLVFKETAELDERVEQGLRDLILVGRRGEL